MPKESNTHKVWLIHLAHVFLTKKNYTPELTLLLIFDTNTEPFLPNYVLELSKSVK